MVVILCGQTEIDILIMLLKGYFPSFLSSGFLALHSNF